MSPRAIPFVTVSKQGVYAVTDEASRVLEAIEGPVGVACCVGPHRSGKSFLLNRVLLEQSKGFEVGPTVQACTKGIWVWSEPIKATGADGKPLSLLVMDSEGLGGLNSDQDADTRLLSLAVLLSSALIYNSVGVVDEYALSGLSLLIKMTNHMRVEEGKDGGAEQETGERFSEVFPSLLWVVRDFALSLATSAGGKLSPQQYLESCLENAPGFSKEAEEVNRVRRVIKGFFPERDCATLRRPVEDEADMQRLDELPKEALRPEFLVEAGDLQSKVMRSARAKSVLGAVLDGSLLCGVARSYVDRINEGRVPVIETALVRVMRERNDRALEAGISLLKDGCSRIRSKGLPMSSDALSSECDALVAEVEEKYLRQRGGKGDADDRFVECARKMRSDLERENAELAMGGAQGELERIYASVEATVLGKGFRGYREYEVERKRCVEEFRGKWPSGPWVDTSLLAFMEATLPRAADAICEKLELAAKTAEERGKEAVKNADADKMMSKEREDALEKRLEACVLRGEDVSKEMDEGLERERRLEEAKRAAEEKWGVLEREKSEIAEKRGRSEAGRRAAEERAERAEEKCRNLEEKLEYVEIRSSQATEKEEQERIAQHEQAIASAKSAAAAEASLKMVKEQLEEVLSRGEETNRELGKLRESLKYTEAKLAQADADLVESKETAIRRIGELNEAVRSKEERLIAAAKREAGEASRELEELKEALKKAKGEVEQGEREGEGLREALKRAEEGIEAGRMEGKELREALKRAEEGIEAGRMEGEELREALKRAEEGIEAGRMEGKELREALQKANDEVEQGRREGAELKEAVKKAEEEVELAKREGAELKEALREAEDRVGEAKREGAELKEALKKADGDVEGATRVGAEMEQALKKAKGEVERGKMEGAEVEGKLNKAEECLMHAQREGAELKDALKKAEEEVEHAKREEAELKEALKKAEEETEMAKREGAELKEALQKIEAKVDEGKGERVELEKALENAEKGMEGGKREVSDLIAALKKAEEGLATGKLEGDQLREEAERNMAQMRDSEASLESLEYDLGAAKAKLAEAEGDAVEKGKELDAVRAKLDEVEGDVIEKVKMLGSAKAKLVEAEGEAFRLGKSLDAAKAKLAEAEAELSGERERAKQDGCGAEAAKEQLEELRREHQSEVSEYRGQVEELSGRLKEADAGYAEANSKVDAMSGRLKEAEASNAEANSKVDAMSGRLKEAEASNAEANSKVDAMSGRLEEAEAMLDRKKISEDELRVVADGLKGRVDELGKQVEEGGKREADLRKSIAEESEREEREAKASAEKMGKRECELMEQIAAVRAELSACVDREAELKGAVEEGEKKVRGLEKVHKEAWERQRGAEERAKEAEAGSRKYLGELQKCQEELSACREELAGVHSKLSDCQFDLETAMTEAALDREAAKKAQDDAKASADKHREELESVMAAVGNFERAVSGEEGLETAASGEEPHHEVHVSLNLAGSLGEAGERKSLHTEQVSELKAALAAAHLDITLLQGAHGGGGGGGGGAGGAPGASGAPRCSSKLSPGRRGGTDGDVWTRVSELEAEVVSLAERCDAAEQAFEESGSLVHSQLEQLFESITAEREERSLQAKWEEVAREGLTKRVSELTEQLERAREGGELGEGALWRALREAEGKYWAACSHLRSVREQSAAGDIGESLLSIEDCGLQCEKAEIALLEGGWEGVWAGGGCQGQREALSEWAQGAFEYGGGAIGGSSEEDGEQRADPWDSSGLFWLRPWPKWLRGLRTGSAGTSMLPSVSVREGQVLNGVCLFSVTVSHGFDARGEWQLAKRFSHVCALHSALCGEVTTYGHYPPPTGQKLVAEKRRGWFKGSGAAGRARLIQDFLNEILGTVECLASASLCQFLDLQCVRHTRVQPSVLPDLRISPTPSTPCESAEPSLRGQDEDGGLFPGLWGGHEQA